MYDIRDVLFEQVSGSRVTACIFSDGDGVLSGVERAAAKAAELGLAVNFAASEGAALMAGDLVMELCGSPKAIPGRGQAHGPDAQALRHRYGGLTLRTRRRKHAHSLRLMEEAAL